jgi:hypothetical protein
VKLFGAFGLTLALTLVVSAIAYISISGLFGTTRDAKRGAILDEQIMSMEIAMDALLDVESTALVYGYDDSLVERVETAFTSNDGDAFEEAFAQAREIQTPASSPSLPRSSSSPCGRRSTSSRRAISKARRRTG